ncbi:unnamed protein product [Peniophora sp. CBMAI 1063]|nr:unnamed protein product [Peniophora sp. CBMAI 1063]
MAVTATGTPAKKVKKRTSIADLAPTPGPTPDGVTETAKKRKKKRAEAVPDEAPLEETPVKARKKEKKAAKDRAEHDQAVEEDLELVVTQLDDAMGKKEKKTRKKSEVAPIEESAIVAEAVATEPSPEKKRKRKSEAASSLEKTQEPVQTLKEKKTKHKIDAPAVLPVPDVEVPTPVDNAMGVEPIGEPTPSKKEKKKRRKSEVAPMDVDTQVPAPTPTATPEAGPSTAEPKKEKRKKHKTDATAAPVEASPEPVVSTVEPVTPAKKEKKRKRKDAEDAMDVDTPAKPAKKSKASAIVNPSSDESLSSSAKEALLYAHAHHRDPAAFKFNKAKQSWLVRNMWKLDEIPENYTPLLAHYLGTVQGQMRKTLTNICKDKLDASDEPEGIHSRAQACQNALAANEPVPGA